MVWRLTRPAISLSSNSSAQRSLRYSGGPYWSPACAHSAAPRGYAAGSRHDKNPHGLLSLLIQSRMIVLR